MRVKYLMLLLYVFASFFPQTLQIPGLPEQVQLTELIFLASVPFFFKELSLVVLHKPWVAVAAGFYGLTNLVAGYLSGSTASLLEAGGRVYLLLLGGMFAGAFLRGSASGFPLNSNLLKHITNAPKYWAVATIGICAGALAFYLSGSLGGPGIGRAVYLIPNYPYFGTVYRMSGTGSSYAMFCMLILPGFLFGAREVLRGKWPWWYLLPIILAALLTFAKENILLVMGLLLLPSMGIYLRRKHRTLIIVCLLVGLYGVTHYMPLSMGSKVEGSEFVSDRVAWQINDEWRIIETNYVAHKRGAIALFSRSPWLGLGPGEFQEHTASLVPEGKYPEHLVGFNPHSIWTGALVETGILGFLSLCLLWGTLWWASPPATSQPVLTAILVCFLVASVYMDIMNFRNLWVLFGWYLIGPFLVADQPKAQSQ